MRRFPWGLTVATTALLALLIGLGVWQVRRLAWKDGLIRAAAEAEASPPTPLDQVLTDPSPEFRRAIVVCRGLSRAPYVELQTIHDGVAGVRLISACRPEGLDQTVLIDRGFVDDAVSARPATAPDAMPVALMVVLRRSEPPSTFAPAASGRHFYARDNAAMARALGVPGAVSPWTFYAVTSSNPDWLALQPKAPPAAFSNNHLGYALTWFGLAAVLLAFYIILARRRLRGDRREP